MVQFIPRAFAQLTASRSFRTFGPAFAGFLGYGGWGFFCNYTHGIQMGLQSGLVQGSFSFTITLIFNGVMEFVYKRLQLKFATIAISASALVGTSYLINFVAGTPNILATIAPGAVVGCFYIFGYVSNLAKQDVAISET